MNTIFPQKLKASDEVRIIAPSRSMSMISQETQNIANRRLQELGLKVSFGKHIHESDDFVSSSIASRITDLHEAFKDPNVKAILTVIGGFNSNQLLGEIDWDLIKWNPKIFCGYSDITALQNAIFARTGVVTYSGPHYSSFGDLKSFDYSLEYFKKCLFSDDVIEIVPSQKWSDDAWYIDQENRTFIPNEGFLVIHEGNANGKLLGGNLCTFNLLQGTEYIPSLRDSVLFLEDDFDSKPVDFDRDLQSLIQQPGFLGVKGLVIGRFQKESQFADDLLKQIIESKKELKQLPIIANVDFGHTTPAITFPVGGHVSIQTDQQPFIQFITH